MKKILTMIMAGLILTACNTAEKPAEKPEAATESTVKLPYTATFSSSINQNVSDQDLLTVLNSYKAWENGNMKTLRATLGDSISFSGWDGFKYDGPADGLITRWSTSRDSLSSVSIKMHVWNKVHFIDKESDVITVWYTEIDTYKNGKIDSAYWADVNMLKNGKISWYSQYRQKAK